MIHVKFALVCVAAGALSIYLWGKIFEAAGIWPFG